jgi:hypothetical protein
LLPEEVAGLFPGQARTERVIVSAPDITFELLDGAQAAAHEDELQALHAEVFADPPYRQAEGAGRFRDASASGAASRVSRLRSPGTAASWSVSQPGRRFGRRRPGGGS